MEKNKILKVCFIIIGFFFVLAIIESSIRAIAGLTNKAIQSKEEKKQEEIEYDSDEQREKRQVKLFLDDIIKAIKDNDYNYIYDSMDETYRECMFNDSINEVRTYMKSNIKIGENYDYMRMTKNGGMYQVLVGNSDDSVYSSQGFSVRIIGDNKYSFMFDEYTLFKKVDSHATYSNLDYNLKCYYETTDTITCLLEIENLTFNSIEIDFVEPSKLVFINGNISIGNETDSIVVASNETNKVEITFTKQLAEKSFLKLNVLEDDVPKNIDISIDI